MRISATKVVSVVAIAAVTALGAGYANAMPNHHGSTPSVATARAATTVTKAGTLHVLALPKKNIARVYSTAVTGGTGQISFTIPNPGAGSYLASFTANFFPAGSPAAPVHFSCYIVVDGVMLTQATSVSTYSSGFYVGVNGVNAVKLTATSVLSLGCGTDDGSTWTWGTRSVQATLTKLDGYIAGSLTKGGQKAGSAVSTR